MNQRFGSSGSHLGMLKLAKNMLMFCFGSGKTSKIDGTSGHFPFLSCRVGATEMFVHVFFGVFPIVTEKSELHGSECKQLL